MIVLTLSFFSVASHFSKWTSLLFHMMSLLLPFPFHEGPLQLFVNSVIFLKYSRNIDIYIYI
jgi:hypothetical protein